MGQSIGDREAELEAFKKIHLSVIASAYGFTVDRKETTRHTVMMRSQSDKIGISQKNGVYVFCSNRDDRIHGTAIDFVTHYVEPGANLGRVRQILRPYLGGSHYTTVLKDYEGGYAKDIGNSSTAVDYLGIASRFSRFVKVEGHNDYLCDERAIPAELLEHPRVRGRLRVSPRHNSIIFPHYGTPDDNPKSTDRCLCGYEIKGQGVNFFSKNGRKGLWASAGFENDRVLAVAESGVDALSYLALHGVEDTRIVSIGGNLNDFQPELIKSAIGKMGQGAVIVSCVDNDKAGDKLSKTIAAIVSECDRADVEFRDDRPAKRGDDWNEVLRASVLATRQTSKLSFKM